MSDKPNTTEVSEMLVGLEAYELKPPTIAECKKMNIEPKNMVPIERFSIKMGWNQMVAMINNQITKGEKLTDATEGMVAIKLYIKLFSNSFL